MLRCAARVRQLVRDRRDDAGLVVPPADALDAGLLTDRRRTSIGGDQQCSPQFVAIGEVDPNRAGICGKRGYTAAIQQVDTGAAADGGQ